MEDKKKINIVLAVVICLLLVAGVIFISVKGKNENMDTNNEVQDVVKNEEVANNGDTVAMNYTGRLQDGTVFDSNVDPKFRHVEPFMFTLGAGQVISGWDKGIVGMKVGEKKTLTIPSDDAYGASGIPGVIPPNATLIFEVELLSINK